MVGGLGEFLGDAQDGFALGDHQSGEILGEMAAPGFAGEEVAELLQGLQDNRREFDDGWHDQMLRRSECARAI